MQDSENLLERARTNPGGIRLAEAVCLAEAYGFVLKRGGKHPHIYKRPGLITMLNFQTNKHGMVKAYQIRQLIKAIDDLEPSK